MIYPRAKRCTVRLFAALMLVSLNVPSLADDSRLLAQYADQLARLPTQDSIYFREIILPLLGESFLRASRLEFFPRRVHIINLQEGTRFAVIWATRLTGSTVQVQCRKTQEGWMLVFGRTAKLDSPQVTSEVARAIASMIPDFPRTLAPHILALQDNPGFVEQLLKNYQAFKPPAPEPCPIQNLAPQAVKRFAFQGLKKTTN